MKTNQMLEMIEYLQSVDLTSWEEEFIESIDDQDYPLTDAQIEVLEGIYLNYNY